MIREIQLGCQIASYKSALDRLNALERKGFIKRAPNKHRGIRVLRRSPGDDAGHPVPDQAVSLSLRTEGNGTDPAPEGAAA